MTDGFALKSWVIDVINKVTKKTVPKYSTNETVVGTWVDGKPIYRRVFKVPAGTVISNSSYSNLPNAIIKDCDLLISATFMATNGLGDTCNYSFHYAKNPDGQLRALSVRNNTSDSIYTNSECRGYVLVEYTKTTDKATIKV